ncbi:glycosyltransferase [Crocinitomix catalasitica]|uniref:glycosyltransferase n=1 Tax=Crocinitomix catalasitica TaxID=184607 RepID=UPI000B106EAD|nr:glycosyltransferase [Crocinitomix catalasitica]
MSSAKHIHLVAFDVPFPPRYGGIIDVFYKIKKLHQHGVKITLHAFYYEGHNQPTERLEEFCVKVYYYKRKKKLTKVLFNKLPFIVSSRQNKNLLKNLLKDDSPILFEGLHTCYYLNDLALAKRKKIVRAHNIEHDYYNGLAQWEDSIFKKIYLKIEAKRLKRFERILRFANVILPIAKMDVSHFSQYTEVEYIGPFYNGDDPIPPDINKVKDQILFHGNLSVKENEFAANYMLNEIVPRINYRFIIAGYQPSELLAETIENIPNVVLIESPKTSQLDKLICESQINLLLTFQQTGVKLKLLHALAKGGHVIINDKMDDDHIFENICSVNNTTQGIVDKINELINIEFTTDDQQHRNELLDAYFNCETNALKIIDLI